MEIPRHLPILALKRSTISSTWGLILCQTWLTLIGVTSEPHPDTSSGGRCSVKAKRILVGHRWRKVGFLGRPRWKFLCIGALSDCGSGLKGPTGSALTKSLFLDRLLLHRRQTRHDFQSQARQERVSIEERERPRALPDTLPRHGGLVFLDASTATGTRHAQCRLRSVCHDQVRKVRGGDAQARVTLNSLGGIAHPPKSCPRPFCNSSGCKRLLAPATHRRASRGVEARGFGRVGRIPLPHPFSRRRQRTRPYVWYRLQNDARTAFGDLVGMPHSVATKQVIGDLSEYC